MLGLSGVTDWTRPVFAIACGRTCEGTGDVVGVCEATPGCAGLPNDCWIGVLPDGGQVALCDECGQPELLAPDGQQILFD